MTRKRHRNDASAARSELIQAANGVASTLGQIEVCHSEKQHVYCETEIKCGRDKGRKWREMGFMKGVTELDGDSWSGGDISHWSNLRRCLSSRLLAAVLVFLGPGTVFLSWAREKENEWWRENHREKKEWRSERLRGDDTERGVSGNGKKKHEFMRSDVRKGDAEQWEKMKSRVAFFPLTFL